MVDERNVIICDLIENGVVSRRAGSGFPYHGWPSVARIGDDKLGVVASAFRIDHLCPFGKVVMLVSNDEGASWSVPLVVADTILDDRDAGICRMDDGSLVLNWFNLDKKYYYPPHDFIKYYKNTMPKNKYNLCKSYIESINDEVNKIICGSYVKKSIDGGYTWSNPVKVPLTSPHGPAQLSDGSLLYIGKEFDIKEGDGDILVYKSADGGYNWQPLSKLPIPESASKANFFEPYAIQADDGRILCHIRFQDYKNETKYGKFTIFQTVSKDCGVNWSLPESLGVCGSPPHIIKHSGGAYVCVFGRREKPYGQRAIISRNNGSTWETEVILRDDGFNSDLGYPASVELKDGSILTVYYQALNKDEATSILYTKWRLP